jgi:hypothetical protein
MNTEEYAESKYITAELVRNSPTKTAVIMDEAKGEQTDFGEKLQCTVQIDGKEKIWRLNRDSVKNMHQLSTDSKAWILAKVRLAVITSKGKDIVLGFPMKATEEKLG